MTKAAVEEVDAAMKAKEKDAHGGDVVSSGARVPSVCGHGVAEPCGTSAGRVRVSSRLTSLSSGTARQRVGVTGFVWV